MGQYSAKLAKGVRWYYKFDYKRTTYKSEIKYLTKSDARKAESELYASLVKQETNPPVKPKFALSEVMNDRLSIIQAKKGTKYYKTNKLYFKKLLKYKGDVPVNRVSREDIENFLSNESIALKQKNKDNYSVNAMLRSYKALFYYAIDVKDVEMKNPCKRIAPFPIKKKIKYIPPDGDIDAVMNICTREQKFLLSFILETGARINEPLKMLGKDVLPDKIILYTKKSKNSDLVPRKLPLPECLKGKTFKADKRVFPWWSEDPKFLAKKIKKLGQEPWGFHSLRHRRASLWNKEKKTIFDIMVLLGHSSLRTTQLYLQMLP